jgi:NAD(P)-dependent dehydrogenase (short-subunit alcohol dehydrogenase family)
MAGRLSGKVAMITGGCSGIGLATVERFIDEGAFVVVGDLQDEKGAMLEKRFPDALRYIHCDVTVEAEIAAACALAASAFGGLDIQFNNGGHSGVAGGLETMPVEGWDDTFAMLLRGPMLGMKHALPLMRARGGGSIISTASIAGLQAGWGGIAYSTAKAGVIHMTRCAAAELSAHNIRVNAICPGLISTSIYGTGIGLGREAADQMVAMMIERASTVQPIPRPGLAADIAAAALYLASDDAAYVSGTYIVVDGAITIGSAHAWDPAVPSPFATMMGISPAQIRANVVGSTE